MTQLDLFESLRAPPVIIPVDAHGAVVQGDVDEHLFLPHPRRAWHRAEIELHRHENGLWMWSASFHCDQGGAGYRVGEKWGRFAQCRDDALFYAKREISSRLDGRAGPEAKQILTWLASL